MADTDPTQTGGQEELSPEERIAQAVHTEKAGDFNAFDEDTGEIIPNEAKEAVETKTEPEPPAVEPGPKMMSIVVDGQTIEVEESRILEAGKRTLQKDQAADRRLQEATQAKRQAEEYLRQVQALSHKDAPPNEPAPSRDAPLATFTPEALDAVLENKLYIRDAQKAAAKFMTDFPEIAADPHLMNMARSLEDQRLSTVAALGESNGDPFVAYQKHGESIRAWVGKFKPAESVPQDKIDRKRTITAIPAVNARAPAPTPDKPPTVSEIIEEERKRREGRPAPNRSR